MSLFYLLPTYKNKLLFMYGPMFRFYIGKSIRSFTLNPLVNLLNVSTSIWLDLYISICFDALSWFLHLLQYHLLWPYNVSVFVKFVKQSYKFVRLSYFWSFNVLFSEEHKSISMLFFNLINILRSFVLSGG
mgnify:CR=1 FL=1